MTNAEMLKSCFLFREMSPDDIEKLISKAPPIIVDFARGYIIYSPTTFEKKIGFILDGKCEVRTSRSGGSGAVMNVLGEGDSFGILAAFSDKEFPTEILATKNTRVMFFDKADIISIVSTSRAAASNLIGFLVNRIEFLNERILTFSGGSVEQKLAHYLITQSKSKGESFDFNRKKAAEAISAGRASVYRALDSFAEDGIISYDSKKIYIIDRNGLERISK